MHQRIFIILLIPVSCALSAAAELASEVTHSLHRAVEFFYSTNIHGGYVYHVTPDLKRRWGENPAGDDTIEVQPPGTPAVGMAFLHAYRSTSDPLALKAASDAAFALLRGQNALGGWEHTINFSKPPRNRVSFDDNQTQSAISFLMSLDRELDDPVLDEGIKRALGLMYKAQLGHGGWPHVFPEQGNYHDYATFNDGGINDCVRVMTEAYSQYRDDEIEESLRKAARFIYRSQLPPPQPGWAQQYNEFMQPAWARTFEPPAVCPQVTVKNLNTLIDLYLVLGDRTLLEPIPDSLRWLDECRLENGKWARFIEIGTGKPLYFDRDRIRVDSIDELHIERSRGYGYETDISGALNKTRERYDDAMHLSRSELLQQENPQHTGKAAAKKMQDMAGSIREVLAAQEPSGAWITRGDRFKKDMPGGVRWNGEYEVADRLSSAVFIRNINLLCEYLELAQAARNNPQQ